ncbi:hypothetical protein JCM15519_30720 [Fundidesulfovibrio butyratiphilus]
MNASVRKWTWAAVLALSLTGFALPALAETSDDYMDLLPDQLEERIAQERQVYKRTMDELRILENGPMDKSSELYRTQLDRLIGEAERSKVTLDCLKEAFKARKQEFRR